MRNHWVEKALSEDARATDRFLVVTSTAKVDGSRFVLLRRVLAWDDSEPPSWAHEGHCGRVDVSVEVRGKSIAAALDRATHEAIDRGTIEVRRVVLPVTDWLDGPSSRIWDLRVPVVAYEVWTDTGHHEATVDAWQHLTEEERARTGLGAAPTGYLGCTVILLPQSRPFLVDVHNLVAPAGHESLDRALLISEVLDGSVVLARTAAPLVVEPWRKLADEDRLRYLTVHRVGADLSSLNGEATQGSGLAAYPSEWHGLSGSDWRLTLVDGHGLVDAASVGLIRGLGGGYFTQEPWRARAPELGFSAPARVNHIPPTEEAADVALRDLSRVGQPTSLADPYASAAALDRLDSLLAGGRLLTGSGHVGRGVTESWAASRRVTVKVISNLHDRFIVGPRGGFLLGTSLNGLGVRHSFTVALDAVMQRQVEGVFEDLWSSVREGW